MHTRARFAAGLVVGALVVGGLGAAAAAPERGEPEGAAGPGMTLREAMELASTQSEPIRRSGLRSALIDRATRVVPMVVVVEDGSRFLEALAAWEWPVRYPVLVDDGTLRSAEQIGRFVRAFGPERVVRVAGGDADADAGVDEDAIRAALARSVRDTFDDDGEALGALRGDGIVSPGVVVIDPEDELWAGGLALAAGRGQRVVFMTTDYKNKDALSAAEARSLASGVEEAVGRTGAVWRGIGDEIDAVTLAVELGVRSESGLERVGVAATTDMVGRTDGGTGTRWAHCGQLFGSMSDGVYQAMCSLFLPMDSAWVWDGYPMGGDWDRYDGTQAGELLGELGIEASVVDAPRNTLRAFELASAAGAVDASLLLMNTKGTRLYYDLPGAAAGMGRPGDLPVLTRPAALHMVHSFSLQRPEQGYTVGGRWLDRGVYLYAGSVDEPYLSGFVPTPDVVRRLGGTLALAAAVHYDDGPVWKIAVIGDPLKTLGPAPERVEMGSVTATIPGVDVGERMRERLGVRELGGAALDLRTLGDDAGLVRLARAALEEAPGSMGDDALLAALHAAVREREHGLALDLFERLSERARRSGSARDMLWLAGRSRLTRLDDRRALALMRTNLRTNMRVHDAEELAVHLKRSDSLNAAVGLLESVRGELDKKWEQRKLGEALERVRR